ncbi:MAG: hypothetical protein IJ711_00795 [Lachnospiraceae bacterium]|nr:hypothetical protein [Lachnospiraceae bacterium]
MSNIFEGKNIVDFGMLGEYHDLITKKIADDIGTSETKSLKTVAIDGNTLKFYHTVEPITEGAKPAYTIELPETDLTAINTAIQKAKSDVDTLDNSLSAVAKSGNASDIVIANEANKFTATDVEGALAELKGDIETVQSAGAIILDHESGTLTYTLYQGKKKDANKIGTIDIPEDMVATNGELYTATSSDTDLEVGKFYIKMTVAHGDPFYIPVQGLIDIYIGSGDDNDNPVTAGIKVNVIDGVINATIVTLDGSKLDAGSIAKTALSNDIQTSLDKADTAEQNAKNYTDTELNKITFATKEQIESLFEKEE